MERNYENETNSGIYLKPRIMKKLYMIIRTQSNTEMVSSRKLSINEMIDVKGGCPTTNIPE